MDNKRKITYDITKVYYVQEDKDFEAELEFEKLLQNISVKLDSSKQRVNGEYYRFYSCKYHASTDIWELQILRYRESIIPGVVHADSEYELIELQDDECVAESSTLLYNQKNSRLYVQRNTQGISLSTLQSYLSLLLGNKAIVILHKLGTPDMISMMTDKKNYRKLSVNIDIDSLLSDKNETTLRQAFHDFSNCNARTVKIELSVGRDRKRTLNSKEISKMIQAFYGAKEVRDIQVTVEDPDSKKYDIIDIIDGTETIMYTIDYSKEKPITHGRLFAKLCQELDIKE